ncbi:MAG: transglycosylase family protein [Solirubrobacterales bacterium]
MGALGVGFVGVLAPRAQAADVAALQARVETARKEARALAGTVVLRNEQFQAAAASAAAAAQRQAVLEMQLARGRTVLKRLRRRLAAATARLAEAQARFRRAQDRLAGRLETIYKSDSPDMTTVLLEADGFEDMMTRATYLKAVNKADSSLVDRVKALRNQVREAMLVVKTAKRRQVVEVRRLADARAQIAAVRRDAQARAAEAERAREAAQSSLDTLHSRISGWTAQVAALQAATGVGGNAGETVQQWFGDFAIPKYIVMCESGGNYKAYNPSSGAGGAYQFMPETYKALGGKYGSPQNAPKWEQDRLAAKLWDSGRGAGNWVCAG